MSDLDILKNMPSPLDRGRQHYESIMEHGTPLQKEAVLIVLTVVASLRPGSYATSAVENACGFLRKSMECANWSDGPVKGSPALMLIEQAMRVMGMRIGTANSDVNAIRTEGLRGEAERALEQAHNAVSRYWENLIGE